MDIICEIKIDRDGQQNILDREINRWLYKRSNHRKSIKQLDRQMDRCKVKVGLLNRLIYINLWIDRYTEIT